MENKETEDQIYESIRRLAAEDPKAARSKIVKLLDERDPSLEVIIKVAMNPPEGRMRQLIANSLKGRSDLTAYVPTLVEWLDREVDEFAKRSIDLCLEGIDLSGNRTPKEDATDGLINPHLFDAYRYVSERLRHRVNNCLLGTYAPLEKIRNGIGELNQGQMRIDLQQAVAKLDSSLQKISSILQHSPGNEIFKDRPIQILAWLSKPVNTGLFPDLGTVPIVIKAEPEARQSFVIASDYHLHTIFWNLVANAQEEIGDDWNLIVEGVVNSDFLELFVSDIGTGFSSGAIEYAFEDRHSTKDPMRGRGLLEIQDAVERLRGTIKLALHSDGTLRIFLQLPIKMS